MESRSKNEPHTTEKASNLLGDARKNANELYEEGLSKVNKAEDCVRDAFDDVMKKVQDNPLSALIIAGGIGFLLSKFMKK